MTRKFLNHTLMFGAKQRECVKCGRIDTFICDRDNMTDWVTQTDEAGWIAESNGTGYDHYCPECGKGKVNE